MTSARSSSATTAVGIAISLFLTAAGFILRILQPPLGEETLFYAFAGIAALGGIIWGTSRKGPTRALHRLTWPASAVAFVVAYDLMLLRIQTPGIFLLGVEVLLFCVATFHVFVLCVWPSRGLSALTKRSPKNRPKS